jgi:hypothetical protein
MAAALLRLTDPTRKIGTAPAAAFSIQVASHASLPVTDRSGAKFNFWHSRLITVVM